MTKAFVKTYAHQGRHAFEIRLLHDDRQIVLHDSATTYGREDTAQRHGEQFLKTATCKQLVRIERQILAEDNRRFQEYRR